MPQIRVTLRNPASDLVTPPRGCDWLLLNAAFAAVDITLCICMRLLQATNASNVSAMLASTQRDLGKGTVTVCVSHAGGDRQVRKKKWLSDSKSIQSSRHLTVYEQTGKRPTSHYETRMHKILSNIPPH